MKNNGELPTTDENINKQCVFTVHPHWTRQLSYMGLTLFLRLPQNNQQLIHMSLIFTQPRNQHKVRDAITIAADEFNSNIFFNCTIYILSSLKIPQLRYSQLEQLSGCQILPGIGIG
jgi:hypothetical protein